MLLFPCVAYDVLPLQTLSKEQCLQILVKYKCLRFLEFIIVFHAYHVELGENSGLLQPRAGLDACEL
jgi:hypothetical protein